MKKVFLAAVLAPVFFYSCQKENSIEQKEINSSLINKNIISDQIITYSQTINDTTYQYTATSFDTSCKMTITYGSNIVSAELIPSSTYLKGFELVSITEKEMSFVIDGKDFLLNYSYDSLSNELFLIFNGEKKNINISADYIDILKNSFNNPDDIVIHPGWIAGYIIAKAIKEMVDFYCEEKSRNQYNLLAKEGCKVILQERCGASCYSWK